MDDAFDTLDGDRRGYVRCRLDRRQWRTDLRMVTTVSRSDAPVYTFASFEVEGGTPERSGSRHAALDRRRDRRVRA